MYDFSCQAQLLIDTLHNFEHRTFVLGPEGVDPERYWNAQLEVTFALHHARMALAHMIQLDYNCEGIVQPTAMYVHYDHVHKGPCFPEESVAYDMPLCSINACEHHD